MTSNTMRTYLRYTIRVTDVTGPTPASRHTDVKAEVLLDITYLLELDNEDIKSLCNSVSKSGGIINDPINVNQSIANPGHNITTIL